MSLSLTTKKKDGCDDYFTPKSAWQEIEAYLPKDALVWEAFYNKDSLSPEYLRELGCNVVSEDVDFFESRIEFDCIVTNPPYSFKPKIFSRLRELNKPFIVLVPVSTITKKFYLDYFANKCGILVPRRRIHFMKNGEQTSRSWFDVVYICFQIEGVNPREIVYL